MDLTKFGVKIIPKDGKFFLTFYKRGRETSLLLGERYWFDRNKCLWSQKGRETHVFSLRQGSVPLKRLAKMSYYHFLDDGDFIFRMVHEDVWMKFSYSEKKNLLLGNLFCHIAERNFWLFLKKEGGKKVRFFSIHGNNLFSLEAYDWFWIDRHTLNLATKSGNVRLRIR